MIHKTCQNYQEFCTLSAKINQAKALNALPNTVKLVDVDTHEESNLCSTLYRVTAVYEYFENTLRDHGSLTLPNIKQLAQTLNSIYHHGS